MRVIDPQRMDRAIIRRGYGAYRVGKTLQATSIFDREARMLPTGYDVDLLSRANNEPFFRGLGVRRCVYFVRSGLNGNVKIGHARRLRQRVGEMQVGNPEELFVLGVMVGGGVDLERQMHKRFAGDWERGEWFRPSKPLLEFILGLPDVRAYVDGNA